MSKLFCAALLVSAALLPISKAQPTATPLDHLDDSADLPLYSIYTAPPERSIYLADQGYRLIHRDPDSPLSWATDTGGTLSMAWKRGTLLAEKVSEYSRPPRLKSSYSDSARMSYSPFEGIDVEQGFAVLSSQHLMSEVIVSNSSQESRDFTLYLVFDGGQPLEKPAFEGHNDTFFFTHEEPRERWSQAKIKAYQPSFENVLMISQPANSRAAYADGADGFRREARNKGGLSGAVARKPTALVMGVRFQLPAQRKRTLRFIRAVGRHRGLLWTQANQMLYELPFEKVLEQSRTHYAGIPKLEIEDRDARLLYWQSFSLVRQMMMQPEGDSGYGYYLFSREPAWGWGHEGQSFPESLAMLTLVHMDPARAMDSQRVYMARQQRDGYIHHRLGPYVADDRPHKKRKSTSAPLFCYTSWELYRVAGDKGFLEEALASCSRFLDFVTSSRDRDKDGLFEWGGRADAESGRASSIVWELLGAKPDSPSQVEALDLNCMLVREMKSAASMSRELDRQQQAEDWDARARSLADRINATMWDSESGFYYHAARDGGGFTAGKGVDLRRMEAIGFLPLWAGIVPDDRRPALIRHLKDPSKFRLPFGLPSLAADDPAFQPQTGECCSMRGAAQMTWSYLIFRGLLDSGYRQEAEDLAQRTLRAAVEELRRSGLMRESWNPQDGQSQSLAPYISAGLAARMMLDAKAQPDD